MSGQIVFTVLARSSTNEPNRLIAASVGLASPVDNTHKNERRVLKVEHRSPRDYAHSQWGIRPSPLLYVLGIASGNLNSFTSYELGFNRS